MKSNNFPIGVFDSGIGGTSIWKEITTLLPKENTIYLSDSKNAPYGEKTKQEIIDLSIKNTQFLIDSNCKLIVVACNTATTNAIKVLRDKFIIPFIGIEPAIKPASLKTKTNTIGILATKGTLNSELFENTSRNINKEIIIKETIGKGLVELIEEGKINSSEMTKLLSSYLNPMLKENVDCLVLGCTHYPYLIPRIRDIIGNKIEIIDSGQAVAKQTKAILEKHQLLNTDDKTGNHQFYINKNKRVLEMILSKNENIKIDKKDF
ncbi:glutamate racemase [Polaribacter reichenbachii]|uniref:Glutamate racemase n=1 Tax=Polaribacter reichenbachii TaxID=996801 RepID=A0A1B8U6X8_9FLAO|nr:glutamate racemase [Polaribacter reichenbachii]APZ46233.1 glutamate racemase [Polaribacter reichenbachii]AUC20095.1 glutamate racemase [Polaribacter reichenbachii]OBY67646.1 glutamate racemase [Polaribacter reichenbachii]